MADTTVRTLALTGGNITIDNGISYVTPEELGVINKPFKHQTGTRAISGSINAYLDSVASNNSNGVYDLILEDANGASPEVTNSFALLINIGASARNADNAANKPGVLFNIPKAHLELPSIDTADVMGVTINFTALEGTGKDELSLKYIGKTPV
jgi:hypothetical protein